MDISDCFVWDRLRKEWFARRLIVDRTEVLTVYPSDGDTVQLMIKLQEMQARERERVLPAMILTLLHYIALQYTVVLHVGLYLLRVLHYCCSSVYE